MRTCQLLVSEGHIRSVYQSPFIPSKQWHVYFQSPQMSHSTCISIPLFGISLIEPKVVLVRHLAGRPKALIYVIMHKSIIKTIIIND